MQERGEKDCVRVDGGEGREDEGGGKVLGEIRGKRAGKTKGGVRSCERVTYLWLQRKTYFSTKKIRILKLECCGLN